MEKYEFVKFIGFGTFGVAQLMRNKETQELVAIKFIERGEKVNENVEREITNHRLLRHPNIVRFKEVVLSPTHLGMVMGYAAGGELSKRVFAAGRFVEDEARYFFQQLISGVNYCHSMEELMIPLVSVIRPTFSGVIELQVCHRDLKLANTLLDKSLAPRVKICDFGYSKSVELHSLPDTAVGTLDYMAPEIIDTSEGCGQYDGKLADVWSCGVTLYVMLVGTYPFSDNKKPTDWAKIMQLILGAKYMIPDYIDISEECWNLISRIFVALPRKRITIEEIKHHPWFLKNLPEDLKEENQAMYCGEENEEYSLQSTDEIKMILMEAKKPALSTVPVTSFRRFIRKEEKKDDEQEDVEVEVKKKRKLR